MSSQNHEPTNAEILEAINDFSTRVEERFVGVEQHFDRIEMTLFEIQKEIETIRHRLDSFEQKWKEESDVYAKEILSLRKRADILEEQIKRFQAAT